MEVRVDGKIIVVPDNDPIPMKTAAKIFVFNQFGLKDGAEYETKVDEESYCDEDGGIRYRVTVAKPGEDQDKPHPHDGLGIVAEQLVWVDKPKASAASGRATSGTWRQLLDLEMTYRGDKTQIIAIRWPREESSLDADINLGGFTSKPPGQPFVAWSEERVYFSLFYNGEASGVCSMPRDPGDNVQSIG